MLLDIVYIDFQRLFVVYALKRRKANRWRKKDRKISKRQKNLHFVPHETSSLHGLTSNDGIRRSMAAQGKSKLCSPCCMTQYFHTRLSTGAAGAAVTAAAAAMVWSLSTAVKILQTTQLFIY